MSASARRAVFLDRDGVLNPLIERDGVPTSPRDPAEFRLVENAGASVARLRAAGFRVFVVTNQPDLGRGLLAPAALDEMMNVIRHAVVVDDIAVCPHDDGDACDCRKPKPGMLRTLAERWQVDLPASIMVGDTWRDMQAGRAAQCTTVLVGAGAADEHADYAAASLSDAVELILTRCR